MRNIFGGGEKDFNPEARAPKESLEVLQKGFRGKLLEVRDIVLNKEIKPKDRLKNANFSFGQAQGFRDGINKKKKAREPGSDMAVANAKGRDSMTQRFLNTLKANIEVDGVIAEEQLKLQTKSTTDWERNQINPNTQDPKIRFELWDNFLKRELLDPISEYMVNTVDSKIELYRRDMALGQPLVRCRAVLKHMQRYLEDLNDDEQVIYQEKYDEAVGKVEMLEEYKKKIEPGV